MDKQEEKTNHDSVFLNPNYQPCDKSDWEKLLVDYENMPSYLREYIEEHMNDPIQQNNSKALKYVTDWLKHPENSQIYRNEILFNNASHELNKVNDDGQGVDWKVEIPIVSLTF